MDIIPIGLSRQVALERQLDIVANNLANVGTTGYKSEGLLFQQYLARNGAAPAAGGSSLSLVENPGNYTDFSEGPIVNTKNPLDVAIRGKGFFAVQTADGVRYTRNGAFTLDAQGRLVTSEGDPVLGTNGPLVFSQTETDITIAPDGTVSSSEGQKGHLRLVSFTDPGQLRRQGFGLYASDEEPEELPPESLHVVSGALEKSNVQPIAETSRLIQISRAYQAVTNALLSTGSLQENAIQQLADIAA